MKSNDSGSRDATISVEGISKKHWNYVSYRFARANKLEKCWTALLSVILFTSSFVAFSIVEDWLSRGTILVGAVALVAIAFFFLRPLFDVNDLQGAYNKQFDYRMNYAPALLKALDGQGFTFFPAAPHSHVAVIQFCKDDEHYVYDKNNVQHIIQSMRWDKKKNTVNLFVAPCQITNHTF